MLRQRRRKWRKHNYGVYGEDRNLHIHGVEIGPPPNSSYFVDLVGDGIFDIIDPNDHMARVEAAVSAEWLFKAAKMKEPLPTVKVLGIVPSLIHEVHSIEWYEQAEKAIAKAVAGAANRGL